MCIRDRYASEPVEIYPWEAPTVKTMDFGTGNMIDPARPNNSKDAWKGCFVYYGSYDDKPVKYRVLDASTTDYSADGKTQTMLLDCDSIPVSYTHLDVYKRQSLILRSRQQLLILNYSWKKPPDFK